MNLRLHALKLTHFFECKFARSCRRRGLRSRPATGVGGGFFQRNPGRVPPSCGGERALFLRQVIIVLTDAVMDRAVALKSENVRAGAVEEIAVVADDTH